MYMFRNGFYKVAAGLPASAHRMNEQMQPRKSTPGFSKRGVLRLLLRRLKK